MSQGATSAVSVSDSSYNAIFNDNAAGSSNTVASAPVNLCAAVGSGIAGGGGDTHLSRSNERLVFHEKCGGLVKLTNGRRTAERTRPLDEFNNGVVMTNRPLKDDEIFEVCFIKFTFGYFIDKITYKMLSFCVYFFFK